MLSKGIFLGKSNKRYRSRGKAKSSGIGGIQ